jgi:proton-translocating NAD(P)+ transhydrogenase subunit alpha
MKIGVPRETFPGERRVALVPSLLPALTGLPAEVWVESGAGTEAGFGDDAYEARGARVTPSRAEVLGADLVVQVRTLGANPTEGKADLEHLRPGTILVGLADPLVATEAIEALARRRVTLFALELLPRTSRAQAMDALTSMATLAGYKAVLLAAETLPRIFPMMVTAAGTLTPARVLVVGAGVAGLQAIATARRLGALVKAYDVRPEVREEIESLGATFAALPLDDVQTADERGYARAMGEDFYRRQRDHLASIVLGSDVVITTAAVPGRSAPRLLTASMVESMAPGSVVVDLAAASGGNCELTRPDERVVHRRVVVLGPTNIPSTLAFHASQMYAKNVTAFVLNLYRGNALDLGADDDIVRQTLILKDGEMVRKVPG